MSLRPLYEKLNVKRLYICAKRIKLAREWGPPQGGDTRASPWLHIAKKFLGADEVSVSELGG
jgi:hypothetical protein